MSHSVQIVALLLAVCVSASQANLYRVSLTTGSDFTPSNGTLKLAFSSGYLQANDLTIVYQFLIEPSRTYSQDFNLPLGPHNLLKCLVHFELTNQFSVFNRKVTVSKVVAYPFFYKTDTMREMFKSMFKPESPEITVFNREVVSLHLVSS